MFQSESSIPSQPLPFAKYISIAEISWDIFVTKEAEEDFSTQGIR